MQDRYLEKQKLVMKLDKVEVGRSIEVATRRKDMEVILSILITVYNQIELVKQNLREIVKYTGKDIEVVINDDGSTEDIGSVIKEINDPRIKYYRGQTNVGHDRNIINGIEHCSAPYVFLLRSRDLIIPDKLELVINTIKHHPTCSYFLFSTTDEPFYVHMALEDKIYKSGKETVYATYKLLIHPSGQIYRKKDLRTDLYREYLKKYCNYSRSSFCVDELIRMDLAVSGDFKTSDQIVWRLAHSLQAKDKATNSIGNGISPYDPELQYPRYACELMFAYNEIKAPYNVKLCKEIISSFLYRVTYMFAIHNRTGVEANHYGVEKKVFSISDERKRFIEYTQTLLNNMELDEQKKLKKYLRKQFIKNATYYYIRDIAHQLLREG